MSDDLTTLLHAAADREQRRFSGEHAGEEATLYERAITPRRAWLRAAEAAGVLAAVGIAAVAVNALVPEREVQPAPPVVTIDSLDRAWRVDGTRREPVGTAADLASVSGLDLASLPGCAALDVAARLEGGDDASHAVGLGTVGVVGEEATNGVVARRFVDARASARLLDEVGAAAEACGDEVAGEGLDVTVTLGGLSVAPGDGVRVVVALPGEDAGSWRVRVHTAGDVGIAVVTEPGATDLSAQAIIAYFAAEPRGAS